MNDEIITDKNLILAKAIMTKNRVEYDIKHTSGYNRIKLQKRLISLKKDITKIKAWLKNV